MRDERIIMSNTKKEDAREPRRRALPVDVPLHRLLDGSFLTRRIVLKFLPYLLFLTLLAVIYIANIYQTERLQRAIDDTQSELKELRYEYITTKSRLMHRSKQSEVAKRMENSGLKESTIPPEKIIITRKDDAGR